MPHARTVFITHPALLGGRRGKLLHQLQAIAQTDLAQDHAITGINILNLGHASLPASLPFGETSVGEDGRLSSSARTAAVSAPSTGTLRPSPRWLPFHSTGSAGTRNGLPSALILLTSPP